MYLEYHFCSFTSDFFSSSLSAASARGGVATDVSSAAASTGGGVAVDVTLTAASAGGSVTVDGFSSTAASTWGGVTVDGFSSTGASIGEDVAVDGFSSTAASTVGGVTLGVSSGLDTGGTSTFGCSELSTFVAPELEASSLAASFGASCCHAL